LGEVWAELDANRCLRTSGSSSSTFGSFAIPADPQVTGVGLRPNTSGFPLCGEAIAARAYSHVDRTGFTGAKSARISISFTASRASAFPAWEVVAARKDLRLRRVTLRSAIRGEWRGGREQA
jgi:hypothetical protein